MEKAKPFSVGIIAVSFSATIFASSDFQSKQSAPYSLEFINGYQFGKYLSEKHKNENHEDFIKGLKAGINAKNSQIHVDQFSSIKANWYKNKKLSQDAKAAYAYGYLASIQNKMHQDFDYFNFIHGLIDALNNSELSYINTNSAQIITKKYTLKKMTEYKKHLVKVNNDNIAKGKIFLAENLKKQDVISMESGLQYKIIQTGQGTKPSLQDKVTLKVIGKKIDGEIFYNSEQDHSTPVKVKLNGTIKAWKQALLKMNKGSIWELYVPSDLAYRNIGFKDIIQPGETLIYQIELIDIESNP